MKRISLNDARKQLEELKRIHSNKQTIPVFFIEVMDDGSLMAGTGKNAGNMKCFETLDDIPVIRNGTGKTTVFVEDFKTVPDDLYLPADILWVLCGSEQRFKLISLNNAGDYVGWLEEYISIIKDFFGVSFEEEFIDSRIFPNSVYKNGHWLTNDELKAERKERCNRVIAEQIEIAKEILKEYPVLVDLLDQYNQLPLSELVERYKDQKWFTGTRL